MINSDSRKKVLKVEIEKGEDTKVHKEIGLVYPMENYVFHW